MNQCSALAFGLLREKTPKVQNRSRGSWPDFLGSFEVKVIFGIWPSWVLKGISQNCSFLTPEDKWVNSSTWQISWLSRLNYPNKTSGWNLSDADQAGSQLYASEIFIPVSYLLAAHSTKVIANLITDLVRQLEERGEHWPAYGVGSKGHPDGHWHEVLACLSQAGHGQWVQREKPSRMGVYLEGIVLSFKRGLSQH